MDHLNTGLHAHNILETWKRGSGLLEFDNALKTASASCRVTRSMSRVEDERQEVLKAVIEHLSGLRAAGESPAYSSPSGAFALLSHLSDSSSRGKQIELQKREKLKVLAQTDEMLIRSRTPAARLKPAIGNRTTHDFTSN